MNAIGEPDGTGDLARALKVARDHRAELSQILEIVDPGRIEARRQAVMAKFLTVAQRDVELAAQLTAVALEPEAAIAWYTPAQPEGPAHRERVTLPPPGSGRSLSLPSPPGVRGPAYVQPGVGQPGGDR